MKASRGFTLIELLLAITILAMIMGVAYSALSEVVRAKRLLDDSRDSRAMTDAILQRFTRELQLAYNGPEGLLPPRDKLEEPLNSRIKLIGEKGDQGGKSAARITFLASEGGQYVPDGGTHSGLVQITYRVEKDPDDSGKDGALYLVREEVPYTRPFDKAYEKAMIFPITKQLESLSFRFYDLEKAQWRDDWGTLPQVGLPAMIEFSAAVRSPEGRIETVTTAVALRASH